MTDTEASASIAPSPVDSRRRSFPCVVQRALAWQLGCGMLAVAAILVATVLAIGEESRLFTWPLAGGLGLATFFGLAGLVAARRVLKPVAEIEKQLQDLIPSATVDAASVAPSAGLTPLEAGWNRLVQFIRSADRAHGLRQRLETAMLEYRQRRGDQVLNALTDGIAVTDETQRITSANNALHRIFHRDPEEEPLRGLSMEEILVRETGLNLEDGQQESGHLGHRLVREIACEKGETNTTLRVCRTPLEADGSSGRSGYVWSVRDVTQQKLADQMRDQFVNAATHELRTPMANIKAYAETLALGEVDDLEQQKMFCNVINDEVTRLARFIDDLLHLSRMEVGATTLQLQVTDMGRLFEEAAEKIRPQMTRKNQAFDVELPGKLPELIVDKDKLAVAVLNLLGNAAKYTPEGGRIRMVVSLIKDGLQVDVEDSGIGISEEEQPKVLGKFYRSSDPRVFGETGSGLGLSITQEIVRLHGGKLSVTSELNQGSRFTIVLPITAE